MIKRLILAHNYYRLPGGEDIVFASEAELLRRRGHEVYEYTDHNDSLTGKRRLQVAVDAVWSRSAMKRFRSAIHANHPELVHFHNTFAAISPSAYYACKEARVPVVQTLHNYRLLCPAGALTRAGRTCRLCTKEWSLLPSLRYGCYHQSVGQTAVVAGMVGLHRLAGTWKNAVDMYIAPSSATRDNFIAAGFDPARIRVKPHFVDPIPEWSRERGTYVLYAGRVTAEKGIGTLLEAWRLLKPPLPLKIIGDGPDRPLYERGTAASNIEWIGSVPAGAVLEYMKGAALLVFPSENIETFGRVVMEAFAAGTPVVASTPRGSAVLVEQGRTGSCFQPGEPRDLARALDGLLRNPDALTRMRAEARREFELHYTAERSYKIQCEIYEEALALARR